MSSGGGGTGIWADRDIKAGIVASLKGVLYGQEAEGRVNAEFTSGALALADVLATYFHLQLDPREIPFPLPRLRRG